MPRSKSSRGASSREQVRTMLDAGVQPDDIAAKLKISVDGVKYHMRRLGFATSQAKKEKPVKEDRKFESYILRLAQKTQRQAIAAMYDNGANEFCTNVLLLTQEILR